MYKTYFFLEGEPASDPFRWRGDLAAEAFRNAVPEAKGYVQTRTLVEQIAGRDDVPFIGVAELWFDDKIMALDSVSQASRVAELLSPGTRIGPITTGMARTVMRLPEHHHGTFIKGVFPFRRISQLTVSGFQRYWWLQHARIAALTEQAVYYLQCHPLAECYIQGRPPYDGITELHWPSVTAAREAMTSQQMTQDQAGDAQTFAEPGSVVLFLAQEETVIAA